jgi:anti-sigma regulatory factor (Ser/Thr protein kinase)
MTDPSAALRRVYDADLRTLHAARQDVVDWLTAQGADEETKERAALIVSELCSNAIQNSPGLTYVMEVARFGEGFAAISVRNRPTEKLPPPRELWRPVGDFSLKELSLRGRGLSIVDSLSNDVTIERLGDELVVTARLRIDADEP